MDSSANADGNGTTDVRRTILVLLALMLLSIGAVVVLGIHAASALDARAARDADARAAQQQEAWLRRQAPDDGPVARHDPAGDGAVNPLDPTASDDDQAGDQRRSPRPQDARPATGTDGSRTARGSREERRARQRAARPELPPGTVRSEGRSAADESREALLKKPGFVQPGRAQPEAPADVGNTTFNWTYVTGGTEYACTTTIAVQPGEGVRRPAQVITSDTQGRVLVTYSGTAFLDADGLLQVDARNAPVSGPWADHWSPDSFAIDSYGYVHSMDDYRRTGDGWLTQR